MTDRTPQILLVDDEQPFLDATAAALDRRGFRVTKAWAAFRALQLVERNDFDALVIDMCMPGMDGSELLLELRYRCPKIPTIVLSGHLSPDLIGRLEQLGAKRVLPKPCPITELADALEAIVQAQAPAGRALSGAERIMPASDDPIRILLVDDEIAFLEATRAALERRGCSVGTCRDAFRALDRIGREDFDAIVVDVRMPFMEGDELYDELKRCRPETPIIILSGHLTKQKMDKLVQAGARQVLRKPCAIDVLLATVLEVTTRQRPVAGRSGAG